MTPDPPLALLAEITHRCPLQCAYCSNPLALERAAAELETAVWLRVLDEAAALGILQVHFSGGEPTARRDLETLIERAVARGLYTNLITSGVSLDRARAASLASAGLDHVQISVQAAEDVSADHIAGLSGAHARKLAAAQHVRAAGLALTINAVVHRQNLPQLEATIALAAEAGAGRLEIAHVQYYGWALRNRAALMPTRAQVEAANATVEHARERYKGRLVIDYVVPDYYARRPKACMGGWGRRFLNVTPSGKVLPCHAAESIQDLVFETVNERSLAEIWANSPAFLRFRGTAWMTEPCRSCDRREIDWGGCRCQALAISGRADRADPACELSPNHAGLVAAAEAESIAPAPNYVPRRFDRPDAPSR